MSRRHSRQHHAPTWISKLLRNPVFFFPFVTILFIFIAYLMQLGFKQVIGIPPILLLLGIVVLTLSLIGNGVNSSARIGGRRHNNPKVNTPKKISVAEPYSVIEKRNAVVAKAVRRAAHHISGNPRLADIGLLIYGATKEPRLCRTSDVPTNTTHIRPYIVIDPPKHGNDVIISFNLIDGAGKLCFQARSGSKHGYTLIAPKTWLPTSDQQLNGVWSLQICGDDEIPFAIHEFGWLPIGGEVRAEFNGDGEIDEQMWAALNQEVEEPISLRELLANEPTNMRH